MLRLFVLVMRFLLCFVGAAPPSSWPFPSKKPALSNSPETSPIFGEQQFLVHLLPTRNVESNHVRAFFELHCAAWLVQTCTVHWKEHGSLLIFTMICGHLWAWVRMGVPNLMTKSMVPRFGILTDTVLAIFP